MGWDGMGWCCMGLSMKGQRNDIINGIHSLNAMQLHEKHDLRIHGLVVTRKSGTKHRPSKFTPGQENRRR
jgi:hypothetical protein